MINVVVSKREKYGVVARQSVATVGKNQNRTIVEVELYRKMNDGKLYFINKGISICHPTDTFNPRIGVQKALEGALGGIFLVKAERKKFFDAVSAWF